jgi:hypothetical protein
MSRRRRAARAGAASLVVGALAAFGPAPVLGHAIGDVFTLPIPLGLYLVGAGLAVAASFIVSAIVIRPPSERPRYPVMPLSPGLARVGRVLLQSLGLAWWLGTILAGYLVEPSSPLPAILFWIGIWVGLPVSAILLGNPWPSLSPFRTLFAAIESVARLLGTRRMDAGLRYPRRLARWPAVVLLFVGGWAELILPDHTTPLMVANLLIGYTVLTLAGMALFGSVAWLRHAELFEVLLGWFGRVGPVGRRVVDPEVCAGCAEGCDPDHCVDCPECAAAADSGERRPELRPWFTGLTEVRSAGWSDAAFIVLALATVTYDGISETVFWGRITDPLFSVLWDLIGPYPSVLVGQTIGLLSVWLVFLAAFTAAVWLMRRMHDPGEWPMPIGFATGAYAATLLPIAGGYFLAHYLTVVIQGAIWVPALLADPLSTVPPRLDWFPVSAIWYLSVGAIVLGHIVAVVLAHRLALRDARLRPVLAGLPLVLLMVGYTVLSLWIIAAPITVEPGTAPSAAIVRAH